MTYIKFENRNEYEGLAGVYGIFLDDECVYVGSTMNLSKRYSFHEVDTARMAFQRHYMYESLNRAKELGHEIEFRPLVTMSDMANQCIEPELVDEHIMDGVELAFIRFYKPYFNSKGLDMRFSFDHVAGAKKKDPTLEF